MSNSSHYQNLGLSYDAKLEAIVAAHAALTKKCLVEISPNADASRYLNAIDTALAVLSDPLQRAAYDQQLRYGEQPVVTPSKVATSSNSAADNRKNKSKTVKSIASELSSTSLEVPTTSEAIEKKSFSPVWGFGLIALVGLVWFGYSKFTSDTSSEIATELAAAPSEQSAAQVASSITAPVTPASDTIDNAAEVNHFTTSDYDAVSIDKLVGSWQGQGNAGVRQALNISLKSSDSLVFSLNTKSGNKIGDIVGVAKFKDGLARFFNAEYGCQLLITRTGTQLNIHTSGCQAFYQKGAEFDGMYAKPESLQASQTKPKVAANAKATPAKTEPTSQAEAPAPVASQASAPPVKLNRYIATVKDSEGKTQRIELVAANEEAARAILRDFRGNPKVVRIRKAWF